MKLGLLNSVFSSRVLALEFTTEGEDGSRTGEGSGTEGGGGCEDEDEDEVFWLPPLLFLSFCFNSSFFREDVDEDDKAGLAVDCELIG